MRSAAIALALIALAAPAWADSTGPLVHDTGPETPHERYDHLISAFQMGAVSCAMYRVEMAAIGMEWKRTIADDLRDDLRSPTLNPGMRPILERALRRPDASEYTDATKRCMKE